MLWEVYRTDNLLTDQCYFGCWKYNKKRLYYYGGSKELQSDMRKYGKKNFRRVRIAIFSDKDAAYETEALYANKEIIDDTTYYNDRTGGIKGFKFNKKTRKQISDGLYEYYKDPEAIKKCSIKNSEIQNRPEIKENNRLKHLGKKRSDEAKLKTSISLSKKPIMIDDIEYRSIAFASRELGIHKATITGRMKNPKFPNYYFINKENNA